MVPTTDDPAERDLRQLHGFVLTLRAVGSSIALLAAGGIALHAHAPRLIADTRQVRVACVTIGVAPPEQDRPARQDHLRSNDSSTRPN